MGQQQCQRWRRTTKEAYRKAVHTAVRIHALLTMCAWRAHIFIEYYVSFFFWSHIAPLRCHAQKFPTNCVPLFRYRHSHVFVYREITICMQSTGSEYVRKE